MENKTLEVKDDDTIVVWFSCGAASAIAAYLTIIKYAHRCNVMVVNNFIKEEDSDNYRFLIDVQRWIRHDINIAGNRKYPNCSTVEVWEDRKYMSGIKGAPCTLLLKKEARYQFEEKHKIDWHVLGFTAEEEKRHHNFTRTERENVLPILIQENISKEDCFEILINAGIDLPEIYHLGYPNANCIGCVKATSPTYWNHVRKVHPEIFRQRAEQSRRLGVRLVRYKGNRIFLDELPEDAKGRQMKSLKMPECGIFCEENKN
jgi:hypothetical protein